MGPCFVSYLIVPFTHSQYKTPASAYVHHRVSGWLPKDQKVLEAWLAKRLLAAEKRMERDFHPVIQEFQQLIEGDAKIYMGFHQMFEQVPLKPPHFNNPTGKPQVRNYKVMLALFDLIITEAPVYESDDVVGFPINASLDWPMGTTGGYAAFVNPLVNEMFHKMLRVCAKFLESSSSRYVLTTADNGWFGPAASAAMPNFIRTFTCDPTAEYYGFNPGTTFSPDASEMIATNIKALDRFWLKGELYSLNHMLHNDSYASQFVGGTVYQAFLSVLSYHRWHSPVNGTVVKTVNVRGTYYAESPAMGFVNPDGPDPAADHFSQAFISAVAARALVFIQAVNASIGLMCFIAVGMAEVSTCEITLEPGHAVKKGDQIGSYFGGSTHCLVFRLETNITFSGDYPVGTSVKLNAAIATVS